LSDEKKSCLEVGLLFMGTLNF